MICPKCGAKYNNEVNFCIECGSKLDIEIQEEKGESKKANRDYSESNGFDFANIQELLFLILEFVKKPFTTMKDKIATFDNIQTSAIMTLIISVISTVIVLFRTMLNAVFYKGWGGELNFNIENLKYVKFVKTIGLNFIIYAGAIAAMAGIYYLACLVIKKETNFSRLLGISTLGIVPLVVCSNFVAPILSYIHFSIGMIFTIAGLMYSLILVYEGINKEIELEGDMKYYFNAACLSIYVIIAYFILTNVVTTTIGNLLN